MKSSAQIHGHTAESAPYSDLVDLVDLVDKRAPIGRLLIRVGFNRTFTIPLSPLSRAKESLTNWKNK
jgi:hypothetical protein